MARSWPLIPVLLLLSLTLGCKVQMEPEPKEVVCPAIAIEPHASLDLGEGRLAHNGSFALEVDIDGERERCTIELSGMSPSKADCPEGSKDCAVASPSTRTSTTCKLIGVGGIQDDGSVRYLDTLGTPKRVNVTVRDGDEVLARGIVEPDYTPDECGFVKPTIALKN